MWLQGFRPLFVLLRRIMWVYNVEKTMKPEEAAEPLEICK
jgi:hypothetical protein